MSNERWNEARLAKLKELQAKGLSLSQIARAINEDEVLSPAGTAPLTRNSVIGKLHRLSLHSFGKREGAQLKIVAPRPIEKTPQAIVAHLAPTGMSRFRSSYFDTVAKLLKWGRRSGR